MYSHFNPFEQGRHRSFGPDTRRRQLGHHGYWPPPPPPFSGWGPHHHGGGDFSPFGPFGPHGGRGGFGPHGRRGGFGPWEPRGRGWGPEKPDDYSSSSEDEDEDPKKPEEISSSDSSSDSSSESDLECHGKGRRRHGRRGRHGHDHGGHGGHCWPPHGRGHHGRHGRHRHGGHGHGGHGGHGHGGRGHGGHGHGGHGHGHGGHGHGGHGGHCWPPHHHHHRGRGPWGLGAEPAEDLPVEDASGFGSDYQVIQDDVVAQMNNLQLQDDAHEDQSTKKCFKVALNADGFKVKDIRIRRHQNQLRVEGKQDAKTYLGTFQRSFAYTITIPSGVNPKKIKTKLGPDGVLRIKAKKSRDNTDNEEVEEIPIKE